MFEQVAQYFGRKENTRESVDRDYKVEEFKTFPSMEAREELLRAAEYLIRESRK